VAYEGRDAEWGAEVDIGRLYSCLSSGGSRNAFAFMCVCVCVRVWRIYRLAPGPLNWAWGGGGKNRKEPAGYKLSLTNGTEHQVLDHDER
jgi:hypothetical protein